MKYFYILFFALAALSSIQAQIDCADGEFAVLIEVFSDQYPAETSWSLSIDGGETLLSVAEDEYNINNNLFVHEVCVPENTCMNFTINDEYGDGICCGLGEGYFRISLDGDLLFDETGDYGEGTTATFGCAPGESCGSALPIEALMSYTAPLEDTWYVFTADSSGSYTISTCDLGNTCNTAIWIYGYCVGLQWDDSPEGGSYYATTGCDTEGDAQMNPNLVAGETYYIRIGDDAGDCVGTAVEWSIAYNGLTIGCTDNTACNFDPLALINDGDCIYPGSPDCPDGPDLIVLEDVIENSLFIEYRNNDSDCFIEEGCLAGYGERTLLRFTTHIENIGEQDYYVGAAPASASEAIGSDQWEWDPCHNHPHFEGYAEYILYDQDQQPIPVGFKNGFCVMDLNCSYGGGTPKYGCSNQGISAHCGDIYGAGLECQWIDITTIPDASYILVVRVNWDQTPDAAGRVEMDYENNWAQACISLSTNAAGIREVNVQFDCADFVDCAGEIYGDAVNDCAGNCNGTALQGDANNDQFIDDYDVEAYVANILANNTAEMITPCLDLDGDQLITVADASLQVGCFMQNGEPIGGVDYCEFPYNVTNIFDTVYVKLGEVVLADRYADIAIAHPSNGVIAFQFSVAGITIDSVAAIGNVYDGLDFHISASEQEIAGVSKSLLPMIKSTDYYSFVRVFWSEELVVGAEICINEVTMMVNELREETMNKYDGGCYVVEAVDIPVEEWSTSIENNHLPNLQIGPNPFSDKTVFNFGETINGSLEVLDSKGSLVQSFKLNNETTFTLNAMKYSAGIYYYKINTNDFNKMGKLVVK